MWSDNASCYQIPTRCYGVPFEQHIFRFGLFLCRNHKGQNLVSTCCFEEPTHMHRQLRVLMWSDNSPDAHRALQLAHQEENSLGLAKYIYIYMAFFMIFYNHRASQDLSDNDRHLSLLFWPDKYLPPSKPPSVPSPPVHPFSTWSAFPWFQLQKFLQLLPVFQSGNKFTMKSHFHSPGFFLLFWLALGLQQVKQH